MRANQPMGLTTAAHALIEGLIPVDSGRTYEGYWDERYPLAAYVASEGELAALRDARDAAAAALAAAQAALTAAAAAQVVAGAHRYEEYEQGVLYSSGPCMFLALRDASGTPVTSSLWSECAMEAAAEGECPCAGELCAPGCPEACADRGARSVDEEGWSDEDAMPV